MKRNDFKLMGRTVHERALEPDGSDCRLHLGRQSFCDPSGTTSSSQEDNPQRAHGRRSNAGCVAIALLAFNEQAYNKSSKKC